MQPLPPLLVALLALAGCAGSTSESTPSDKGGADTVVAPTCPTASGLSTARPEVRPGDALTVTLADLVDPDGVAVITAESDQGEVVWGAEDPGEGVWTLKRSLAQDEAQDATLNLILSAEGCADQDFSVTVTVNWTEADRAMVLYNPSVDGSETVARAYADFRGLSDAQLCGVAYDGDTTTMAGADFDGFMASVLGCLTDLGAHIQVVVPVYGVPYKVSDRVVNIGSSDLTTISLDALIALGDRATSTTSARYSPVYQSGDSLTGTYAPYVPFGSLRAGMRHTFYLVSRIDGVSADAAIALIDRTAEAEALAAKGALDGIVYVDGQYGDVPPATDEYGSYESGEWNMWGTRTIFEELGLYDVVWDGNVEEFGTAPAPTECPDALYYAGWYHFENYNDAFTWAPGAIGGHLDSCSACEIRGGASWASNALERGITATFGAVNEPYVAGLPEYDQLFLYLLQGATFGEAAYESTTISGWMMVYVGDPLYRPYPGGVSE